MTHELIAQSLPTLAIIAAIIAGAWKVIEKVRPIYDRMREVESALRGVLADQKVSASDRKEIIGSSHRCETEIAGLKERMTAIENHNGSMSDRIESVRSDQEVIKQRLAAIDGRIDNGMPKRTRSKAKAS